MFPERGRRLPNPTKMLSEVEYIKRISEALRAELAASRRSTNLVETWTGASGRTARTWISGRGGPSGRHLILLARESKAIWEILLELTAHEEMALAADIHAVEVALAKASGAIEMLKRQKLTARPQ